MTISPGRVLVTAIAALGALIGVAPAASAFDPATEAKNFSKTQERQTIYNNAQYQLQLRQVSQQNQQRAITTAAADPERNFHGQLCATGEDGCAGDVRLYDWKAKGYGIVEPVLFTARSGATISGHVWATRSGPAKRPGIVITNGSVQAPEQLYWFAAQTLAKAGYVVLTSDPQGQGQSDGRGEAPDENEGFPAQSDGRPFYDGTRDALDFFLSTPTTVYKPRKSCETGTRHVPKQNRRVAAGLNAAYNPFWNMINQQKIGIAGHSFGAAGVSFIGQKDPRVRRDRRVGQPRPPGNQRRPAGEAMPGRPGEPRGRADHEAGARHVGRLRPHANAVHGRPRPAGQEPGLPRLLGGGRRHG